MAFGKLTGCGTSAANIKMRTNGSHLKSVLRQNFIASKWLGCNASVPVRIIDERADRAV